MPTIEPLTLICPRCNGKNIITTQNGESWCRKCGYRGATDDFVKKEDKV